MSSPFSLSFWRERLRGGAGAPPTPLPTAALLKAGLGGVLAIALVGWLAQASGQPWVLGSFGASCVMVFAYPDLPFSQPRHVLGGHVLASAIGLACLTVFGPHWWAMALAVGLAIVAMIALRVPHPPAGSNPVIVFLAQPGWSFLLFPTLAGAVLVLAVALLYNNLSRDTPYPKYW
jgi:CBS-domain-containing membrane protein